MSSPGIEDTPIIQGTRSQPTQNESESNTNIVSPQDSIEMDPMARFHHPTTTDRLSNRVNAEEDFTLRDEIMLAFEDLIKCPILLDNSSEMIIFNLQCYDKQSFDTYKQGEEERNRNLEESGYSPSNFTLKDPRTNTKFTYNEASRTILFNHFIPKVSLVSMIMSRIPQIHLNEIQQFIPETSPSDNVIGVNAFVRHIKSLLVDRAEQRRIHLARIRERSRASYADAPVRPPSVSTSDIQQNNVEVLSSDSEDEELPSASFSSTLPNLPSLPSTRSRNNRRRTPGGIVNPRPVARPRTAQQQLPVLSNFLDTPEGQSHVVSILSAAKDEGFDETLVHGSRVDWFRSKVCVWFNPVGGFLNGYRRCSGDQLRRKFKAAEQIAKRLYNSRGHQDDETGEQTEGDRPLYVSSFFEYFDFLQTRNTQMMTSQRQRDRHRRVNRSLIGQQPALSSETASTTLNDSVAPPRRERGTGEVATNVEFDVNEEAEPSNPPQASNNTSSTSTSTTATTRPAPRSRNVSFGIANSAFLPPSATDRNGVNVDRIERSYHTIAASINNLATQNRLRRTDVINDDIIKTIKEKNEIAEAGGDDSLVQAYERKVRDLEAERDRAERFDNDMMQNMHNMQSAFQFTSQNSENN